MAKHKGDIEIGMRAVEEMHRRFPNISEKKICERVGLNRQTACAWNEGKTPGGFALQKLYYAGCDVKYILTGIRSIERS